MEVEDAVHSTDSKFISCAIAAPAKTADKAADENKYFNDTIFIRIEP